MKPFAFFALMTLLTVTQLSAQQQPFLKEFAGKNFKVILKGGAHPSGYVIHITDSRLPGCKLSTPAVSSTETVTLLPASFSSGDWNNDGTEEFDFIYAVSHDGEDYDLIYVLVSGCKRYTITSNLYHDGVSFDGIKNTPADYKKGFANGLQPLPAKLQQHARTKWDNLINSGQHKWKYIEKQAPVTTTHAKILDTVLKDIDSDGLKDKLLLTEQELCFLLNNGKGRYTPAFTGTYPEFSGYERITFSKDNQPGITLVNGMKTGTSVIHLLLNYHAAENRCELVTATLYAPDPHDTRDKVTICSATYHKDLTASLGGRIWEDLRNKMNCR